MNLTVLGERVFIRPELRPAVTESGLALVYNDARSTVKGTVLAVGEGPEDRKRAVEGAMAPLIARMTELADDGVGDQLARAIVATLRGQARGIVAAYQPEHLVEVGDSVVFSPDAGEELIFENEVLISMRESDILAVIEKESE